MKLYTVYRCPFGHRASIALREKELAFEPVFFTPKDRPAELQAISPFARSPTLVDEGAKVFDSLIVLEYLEEQYPKKRLMPAGAPARAEVRMLMACVAEELLPHAWTVARQSIHGGKRDETAVDHAIEEFKRAFEGWDRRLEGRTFLVGDALTFADIVLFTVFPSMHGLAKSKFRPSARICAPGSDRMMARPSTPLLAPASPG